MSDHVDVVQSILRENQRECEHLINKTIIDPNEMNNYCAPVFDGILCWPKTFIGVEAIQQCPDYFAFSSQTNVTKICTENATWYFHDALNTTWTNYTQCRKLIDDTTGFVKLNNSDISQYGYWLPKLKTLNHIGYGLSLTTLILAITIFLCFKKLRCARNRLHMHLFLSFTLKALVTLLKDYLFVDGIVFWSDVVIDGTNKYVKEHNFWPCKAITSSWQYFILTNYFLILMEGIYLHNLLFLALVTDKGDIHLYATFGWGLPAIFLIPWIVLKILYDDHLCWTNHNQYLQLLIHIPIDLSIFINFVLFAKIVNILLIKLNVMFILQRRMKYRRLIRSTLILMPLFGVPYVISILTWFYATQNKTIELIWLFFDQTFTSLQGFFVGFLYCLLNNEVQNELKKSFLQNRKSSQNRNSFPLYATITNRFSFTTDNNERQNI